MRKEWKKSLLVFKMSQCSLFECGVSKKCKADESDLADNAECVYVGLFWSASAADKETKTFVCHNRKDPFTLPRCLVRPVWLAWIRRPVKMHVLLSCRKKQEHFLKGRRRCVYFCGVNAHFPRFVRLKNKKTRKDLMQTWKFKTKKKKINK